MTDVPRALRLRVRVTGIVQGVGMRPHVFNVAERLGLAGFVTNDEGGVTIEVEGEAGRRFVEELRDHPPALARVDALSFEEIPPLGDVAFVIRRSSRGATAKTAIPADVATCPECLAEIFDPTARRYRYPFTNCTACGPRFTITRRLPYDRPETSMAHFPMCPDCAREYGDPRDRRFHAQPIACPACGPKLSAPLEAVLAAVRRGEIVGLKGLGGYHLVADARNAAAVDLLRRRKHRDKKPFALMVANVASARLITKVSDAEAQLLTSRTRPIVLLDRRLERHGGPGQGAIEHAQAELPDGLAPGLSTLGVMLPYTPLHYLLFFDGPAALADLEAPRSLVLVMTSANVSGEPLVIDDEDAKVRLAGIADRLVTHDRTILVRADDGVERVIAGTPTLLRRARGHAPEGTRLARETPPILAFGAELKSTFTVTRGREAFVSPHLGDLDDPATRRAFDASLAHYLSILEVAPALVAHDLHPDFWSTRRALGLQLPTVAVQHHHAHVASVLAEHGREGAIGLALDGYGYGTDGGAWGGELLFVDGAHLERLGHLRPLLLPGGDRAAKEPWRMGAAALFALGRADEIPARFGVAARALTTMMVRGTASPPTTSLGRWFDAAAALAGVSTHQAYEGEAAMRLEGLVSTPRVLEGGFEIRDGVLDLLPVLAAMGDRPPVEAAELFHGTLARGLFEWTLPALRARGHDEVVVTGGCAANRVLVEALEAHFASAGVRVLRARRLPPNDGGLSLGQAWVAARAVEQNMIGETTR